MVVKITAIKTRKKNIIIEVENNGTTMSHITTEHIVLKYRLEKGMTLKNEDYKRFIRDTEFEILYLKAIHYISYQMRSISEVKKHLQKSTQDNKVIDNVIQELKKHKYLSDTHFVKEYVSEMIQYQLVGPIYIKDKLIQKGIHYDLIDAELIAFTEDIEYGKVIELIQNDIKMTLRKPYMKIIQSMKRRYSNKGFRLRIVDSAILSMKDDIKAQIDEGNLSQRAFDKMKKDYDLSTYEGRQKCMQKLLRQGYSYDTVKRLIKEVD